MIFKKQTILLFLILFSIIQIVNSQTSFKIEIGEIDSLHSTILNESREIYIQLPESYNPDGAQRYPVIYVLDGDVLLNAVSTVHSYYWGGFMPEMVIVGISNAQNRSRDLTTSSITLKQGMPYNDESGGAEKFTSFIEKELLPYIETKYPVTSYRTLIGHSYGGLFAVNALINHSDLFQNYLIIDPSLDWDEQKLLKQSKKEFEKRSFEGKSIFMSLGGQLHMQNSEITIDNVMKDTSEYTLFARSNIEFSKLAEKSDLRSFWKFYPNDLHGSIPLPSMMDGLISIFSWYQMENTDFYNNPETPKDELFQLIRYREKKLKDHFGYFVPPIEEGLINMLGYMNLEWGNPEKSLECFELCIEYFPNSANGYDSLADYYVSQEDYKNALIYVTIAFEMSGDEYYKERMEEYSNK